MGPTRPRFDAIRRTASLLLLLSLPACVSKSTEVTLPLDPSGLDQLRALTAADSTSVLPRSGGPALVDAWLVDEDGVELASTSRSLALAEVSHISGPMNVTDRVWRAVPRGALYGSAALSLYYFIAVSRSDVADGDNGPVAAVGGGVIGAGVGFLYGLFIPANHTYEITGAASVTVGPSDPNTGSIVLVRISF